MPEDYNSERAAETVVPFCEMQTAASLLDIQLGLSEVWHLIVASKINDALATTEQIEQRLDHRSPLLTPRYRAAIRLLRLAALTFQDDRLAVFAIAISQVLVEKGARLESLVTETWNRTEVLEPMDRLALGSMKSADSGAAQAGSSVADAITAREREVLVMVSQGYSNKRIARRLEISPETVKSHLRHIFSKLAVSTRSDAVSRAVSLRLLHSRIPIGALRRPCSCHSSGFGLAGVCWAV